MAAGPLSKTTTRQRFSPDRYTSSMSQESLSIARWRLGALTPIDRPIAEALQTFLEETDSTDEQEPVKSEPVPRTVSGAR